MRPPNLVGNAELIAYLVLNENNIRTGNTEHFAGGKLMETSYGLAICRYENEKGFYLFYCDSSWETIADTCHDSVEDAKDQATFEYTNTENSWVYIK